MENMENMENMDNMDAYKNWTCPECLHLNADARKYCDFCQSGRPERSGIDGYSRIKMEPTPCANVSLYRAVEGLIRVSWDEYFMDIARVVSSRSTCPRKSVGAVLVRDKTILSTGYNGSIRGMPHCVVVGCMMENDHCVATIHAESNAILQAARNGVMIDGGTLYVTASPCWNCFKEIANSGIRRVVYGEFYRDDRIFSAAASLNIELVHLAGK